MSVSPQNLLQPNNAYVQNWQSVITVNGTEVNCYGWEVDVGTYGQLGKATFHTTVSQLVANNVSLTNFGSGVRVSLTANGTLVFGGRYLCGMPVFHEDEFSFSARDFSAVLFDTKRSLAALGTPQSYQNQTVSQLVRQICLQFGAGSILNTDINITNDPLVGNIFNAQGAAGNGGANMSTYPRTMWNLLVMLARSVGAQIYTTPDQTLHFVDANVGANLQFSWMPPPTGASTGGLGQANPILLLEGLHQPDQNKNFIVIVKSHHGPLVQDWISTVTVTNQAIQTAGGKTVPAGFYTGSNGVRARGALAGAPLGIPVYEFRRDGLTQDGVQAAAAGLARDIAEKFLILTATVDGNLNILPNQQVNIAEVVPGSLLGFAQLPLFISDVKHHYMTPQDEGIGTQGFLTTMKLITIPPTTNPTTNDDFEQNLGGGI
jgi:hypothetical protein